ncbi:MAG: esterase/lipase family protein [Nocardioidaceae bacterium]
MEMPNPFTRLGTRPPIWREGRLGLELAALLTDPVHRGEGLRDGRGQPVLLIPGFLTGDGSLAILTQWLRRGGYHTRKAGIRLNVGCSGEILERLEERLEGLVELADGRRAAIIGQSRGGALAKVLARRRPDLTCGVVTLGTPLVEPLAVHPLVALQLLAVGALGSLGAPGLFRRACLEGECCADFWRHAAEPPPRGVRFVSVYSRSDGVVDWRSCLCPHSELVEVDASHIGMAFNAEAYRAVAGALNELTRREARRLARRNASAARREASAAPREALAALRQGSANGAGRRAGLSGTRAQASVTSTAAPRTAPARRRASASLASSSG